ncbi:hypothetical protein CDCA_CDCA07G2184 [Cyanidium caldarium]|uniref:Zinc finger protein n=1 Tax=Cyanidium caldarium TaxID=2771 RepID=A0AAV9IV45_CYACA|nr:hypothetical protein CDCA_CDCA07G2184 [Cyanidium caldarium]
MPRPKRQRREVVRADVGWVPTVGPTPTSAGRDAPPQNRTVKAESTVVVTPFKTERAPLLQLFHFHKAIRRELESLAEQLHAVSDAAPLSLEDVDELMERLVRLRSMLEHHCASEDNILLPVLLLKGCDALNAPDTCACHESSGFHKLTELLASLEQSWRDGAVATARDRFEELCSLVEEHLRAEEEMMTPFFCDLRCLSLDEQGRLFVKIVFSMPLEAQSSLVLRALRALNTDQERAQFLGLLERYASAEDFSRIAGLVVHDMPRESFQRLATLVPRLSAAAEAHLHPLMEIRHIHLALRKALDELQREATEVDPHDDLQLRALATQVEFLRSVHTVHSDGEDSVFLQQLDDAGDDDVLETLRHDHGTEDRKFEAVLSRLAELRAAPSDQRQQLMERCRAQLRGLVGHLVRHMGTEESRLFPILEQYSVGVQDRLVREVMRRIPEHQLHTIIPWLLNSLPMDEREKMLRNLLRSMPQSEFDELTRSLTASVNRGILDGRDWHELARRIPEIAASAGAEVEDALFSGPVAEIMRVHKAIRIDLQVLTQEALRLDAESLNPRHVATLRERYAFLQHMVTDHSDAEDRVVLPALAERVHGVVQEYEDDHHCEKQMFGALGRLFTDLQCAGTRQEMRSLTQRIRSLAMALRVDLMHHLEREEAALWPLLVKHFERAEQTQIVGDVFGQIPAERIRELLPWMVRVLSRHESANMMQHILTITRSTMFEQWLRTWFKELDVLVGKRGADAGSEAGGAGGKQPREPTPADADEVVSKAAAAAEKYIRQAMGDVEHAVRAIARDHLLSDREKSLLMQNVMILQWKRKRAGGDRGGVAGSADDDVGRGVAGGDSGAVSTSTAAGGPVATTSGSSSRYPGVERTYRQTPQGRILGCQHYARTCRLLAPCCKQYFTCRLCHDEARDHVMDRYAVERILCMQCLTEQAPAESCVQCGGRFARYACLVCKLYDDAPDRHIYHCGYCNVCRVGQGLGIDFIHCMRCNACMSTKYAKNHRCIERRMESDCPVCGEYLFTSTTPVKFLRCGHLMHASCYKHYAATDYRCPICKKSLADMSAYFEALLRDKPMPLEYRGFAAQVACNDCGRLSTTEFHFLYNKCASCHSYNTRVLQVSASAPRTGE